MADRLEGRDVLITGASRGIGEAIARGCAERGARVILVARSEGAIERLAEELEGVAIATDLVDDLGADLLVERVEELCGGAPDAVVHAAGVFDVAPLGQTSDETLDRNWEVNARAAFRLFRAFIDPMTERGSGDLVTIGSVAGRKAFPANAAYSASKFGVRGLHEVLVEETRGTGLRPALIEPSATDTAIWDPMDPDENPELPSRDQMLTPSEVAEAVIFVLTRPAGVRVPLIQIERG